MTSAGKTVFALFTNVRNLAFASEKLKMTIKISLFRNWQLIQFFHHAFANPCRTKDQWLSRIGVRLTGNWQLGA
jgi:hypothetical protein